jgi:aminopeptidase YwaD
MSDDMNPRNRDYALKASEYLETLCGVKLSRRTGSPGNREATDYVARVIEGLGFRADAVPFPCLDYACGESSLTCKGRSYVASAINDLIGTGHDTCSTAGI